MNKETLSNKRKEILKDLQEAHRKMLLKGFISYGTFHRVYDKILKQDKEAIKRLRYALGNDRDINKIVNEIFGEELTK